MTALPTEIYTVAAVRQIDRHAIDSAGIPGYTLMCRAGEAALGVIRQHYPDARRYQVICGPGNNGGDGYVVARLARAAGIDVSAVAPVDTDALSGDAATACRDFLAAGGTVERWSGALDPAADVLVDALLGSGLQRTVSGDFADVVACINAHGAGVVALDIPSGIHGDTGEALGRAVDAEVTVTFVGLKTGLFAGDGLRHCGQIEFAGLDIPAGCRDRVTARLHRLDDALLASRLPKRHRDVHKGDHGHVLVVGGGTGMPGAALLCGAAALRTGAGRVTVATDPGHAAQIAAARPELMVRGVDDGDALLPILERVDVIAFGPGLGTSAWAESLYVAVLAAEKPAVWDADALNLLVAHGGRLASRIITPHPGEAARLLEVSAGDVQRDRIAALEQLQMKFGGTVVLKGAGSLVGAAGVTPLICTAGNPGMAAPGMGDVLTGVIAALLAQGLTGPDAAAVGVQAHAKAGDRAARRGERGLIASDVIDALRAAVNP